MRFCHFSNFCRKKFPGLVKEISCTYWMNLEERKWVWGWFIPKTFQGLHFLFSGSLSWLMYIWAKCPWNKFDEKAQCEHELNFRFVYKTLPILKTPIKTKHDFIETWFTVCGFGVKVNDFRLWCFQPRSTKSLIFWIKSC